MFHRASSLVCSSVLLSIAGLLSGCASTQSTHSKSSSTEVSFPIEATAGFDDGMDATTLTIHTEDSTTTVSFDEMIDDLSKADIILVGEMHGHTPSLDFIATTFEQLADHDDSLALSMEFYERDLQTALDDYLGGITDYAKFVKAANRNTGNNHPNHLRMVERCRIDGRRVIAANSPRRYTKLARTKGYNTLRSLTPGQQSLLAIPDSIPTGIYADRFRDAMGTMAEHGGDEMINSFLRAQFLWDATMAQSVARAYSSGVRVFHVVGHFHVDHALVPTGSAMTDRIRSMVGDDVVIKSLVMHARDLQPQNDEESEIDAGPPADYVVYFDVEE